LCHKQRKVLANEHDRLHESSDFCKERRNSEQLLSIVQLEGVHAEVDREDVWLQLRFRISRPLVLVCLANLKLWNEDVIIEDVSGAQCSLFDEDVVALLDLRINRKVCFIFSIDFDSVVRVFCVDVGVSVDELDLLSFKVVPYLVFSCTLFATCWVTESKAHLYVFEFSREEVSRYV